jgi:hypothetical protein
VPTGTAADAKQECRAALARRKNPARNGKGVSRTSLGVLDRLCAIEADNNTDQIDAHTEDGLPHYAGDESNRCDRAMRAAQ